MNHNKPKNFVLPLLLVAGLLSEMILSPVTMTKAEAKTKLSVTARVGSKKVNKKDNKYEKGQQKKNQTVCCTKAVRD